MLRDHGAGGIHDPGLVEEVIGQGGVPRPPSGGRSAHQIADQVFAGDGEGERVLRPGRIQPCRAGEGFLGCDEVTALHCLGANEVGVVSVACMAR